jgi:CRISPR/Cas system-associated exonuclease Cas4 (RecB family)
VTTELRPDHVLNPKVSLAETLAFDIQERRKAALKKKITQYPKQTSYLSDVGECDRQMAYSILNWQDRPLHDEDLQALFDAGKEQENVLVRELMALGYEFMSGQEVIEIKNRAGEVIARGRIDGKIRWHGVKIPVEIKAMNAFTFDDLDSIEDFHKKPHLRKYLRQLRMYCHGNNEPEGLLLCTDFRGHWKIFVVQWDAAECEQILQRLERVHEAVKAKTLPARIDYRDEICGKCSFAHICLPDILRKESEIITDDEFIQRLEQRAAVTEAKSLYERLDKSIKADIKKRVTKQAIAGDFFIKISDPVSVAERTTKAYSFQKVSIERMGEIEKAKNENP